MLIRINGSPVEVSPEMSVAAAVMALGVPGFRPICGMGICFECRVRIDGLPHVRGCQIPVREGMEVET